MPRTATVTLYQFAELSESAKENAREWERQFAAQHEWWEYIFEDAERLGVLIRAFDFGGREYIKVDLVEGINEICRRILQDHGADCGTYKLAQAWFANRHKRAAGEYDAEEFRRALGEEYLALLECEYEYLISDESIDEMIVANGYEFDEEGAEWK